MRKNSTYEEKRKAGFTLVELIVVLVMLSILTAVAVPTYMGYVDDNKAKQCETHRKALASRLEEMSAMGSTASLTEDEMNSAENGCPAGGKYTLEGSGNTIHCDKHGDTTVILKSSAGIVTADVNNVQTEAPKETATPTPDNSTPVEPIILSVKISPNSPPDMEIGEDVKPLSAEPVSQNCSDIGYIWNVESGNAVHIEGDTNSKTVSIKADHAGTSTISCRVTATSDVDSTTVISEPATVDVTVNPVVPTLSYSVDPASVEMEAEGGGGEKTLSVVNLQNTYCTVNDFSWSVDSEGIVQVTGNGETATLMPLAEGTCTIHCQASDIVVDSDAGDNRPQDDGADVRVTVNAKKSLEVSLSPNPLKLKFGESLNGELTANVQMSGYQSYECVWTIDRETIASIKKGTEENKANVNGLLQGTAEVTCTVIADQGAAQKSATAMVVVEDAAEEVHLPEEILIKGWNSDEINAELYKIGISVPAGGYWSSSNENVKCNIDETDTWIKYNAQNGLWEGENGYIVIKDNRSGGSYPLTYHYKDKSYTTNARVVYPIEAVEGLQEGNWPDDSTSYTSNEDDFKVEFGKKTQIWLRYQLKCTTDRDTIQWTSSNSEVAAIDHIRDYAPESKDDSSRYSIITLNAITLGETTIKVTAYNEYEKKEVSKECVLRVYDPKQMTSIKANPDPMVLKKGQGSQQIQINYEPWTASIEGVTYQCTGYDGNIIDIDEYRNVTPKENGMTTVTVQALKDGEPIEGCSCSLVVVVTDLEISVDPNTVKINQGEQGKAKIICSPPEESDGIMYELSYDTNVLTVTEQNGELTIEAKQNCSYPVWVTVKAIKDNIKLKETSFAVQVISGNSNTGNTHNVAGKDFICASWEDLRSYLKNPSSEVTLPARMFELWGNVYVLTDLNILWDDKYENMSFEQFYSENSFKFAQINTGWMKDEFSNGDWCVKNVIVFYNGKYYLALQDGNRQDADFGNEEYFIELTIVG